MCVVNFIALVLIIIGSLNWGTVGVADYNFVSAIFGQPTSADYSAWERIIYTIVGLAGIWSLSFFAKCRKICSSCKSDTCDKDQK